VLSLCNQLQNWNLHLVYDEYVEDEYGVPFDFSNEVLYILTENQGNIFIARSV